MTTIVGIFKLHYYENVVQFLGLLHILYLNALHTTFGHVRKHNEPRSDCSLGTILFAIYALKVYEQIRL